MKYIGEKIEVLSAARGPWHIKKVIIDGRSTPKWAVFRNGTHTGTERLKRHAITVCKEW